MIINLKENLNLLKEYIELRNTFLVQLLTKRVTLTETKEWITNKDVEVICEFDKKILGICILHVFRKGEVTIFIKDSQKGIGTKLLKRIEGIARRRNLLKTWVWVRVDNSPANTFFLKNGYLVKKTGYKLYQNKKVKGIIYEKLLT